MATDTDTGAGFSGDDILTVISGGFVGAILLGLVFQWGGLGRSGVIKFGALIAQPKYSTSWTVLFVLSALFSILFVGFVSRSINTFVNRVIMLSSRSNILKELLVPLLERSALTVTTTALGVIYGFVIWFVFYALFVPLWLTFAIPEFTSLNYKNIIIPNLGLTGLIAWVGYGTFIGLLYGFIMNS